MNTAIAATPPIRLVSISGEVLIDGIDAWFRSPGAEESVVLDRAVAPVLDIGCGPGRHVEALAARGVLALGVDASPSAVALAHERGAPVLERSIFERVPGTGRWASALLLDGNLGIGGNPPALLRRIAELLKRGGRLLLELGGPNTSTGSFMARIERDGSSSPWFPWARVGIEDLAPLALECGYRIEETWEGGGRWFGSLRLLSLND